MLGPSRQRVPSWTFFLKRLLPVPESDALDMTPCPTYPAGSRPIYPEMSSVRIPALLLGL